MPLKNCNADGKSGYKWGDKGNCYTGKDGKKKAIKQGIAIEGPEKFSQKAQELKMLYINDENIFLKHEDLQYISDWMHDEGYNSAAIVATVSSLLSKGADVAGYPPNCNEGYVEKDGKCVPIKTPTSH